MKKLRILLVALAVGLTANAWAGKPKSRLKAVYYHVGGGMMLGHGALVDLKREKDGRQTLTLLVKRPEETVTFEVGDSVFERCEQLIRETKVYKAKGYYDFGEFIVLDAPSTDFSVTYENYNESFSAGGNIPPRIRKGIDKVVDYLNGLLKKQEQ